MDGILVFAAEIVINVMEYWILLLIMQYLCSAQMILSRKRVFICTLAVAVSSFLMYLSPYHYPVILLPLLIGLTVLWLSRRKCRDLLLFFPTLALYMLLTVIPESMLEELFPTYQFEYDLNGTPLRLHGLATDLALLCLLLLLGRALRKYETKFRLTAGETLGSIALLLFSLIDVPLLMAVNRSNMRPPFSWIWKIIFVGSFICGAAYYFFCLTESRLRVYRQSLSRCETEYLQAQLDSLQDIRENENQVRQLRHDLQNHLDVIRSLCEEGNYEDVKNYTGQLIENIQPGGSRIMTGNQAADLIIRSKQKTAEARGITFTFSGSLEQLAAMAAPDICGLLANAYDNAIEACLSQKSPFIRTAVSSTRNHTVIQIDNSVSHRVPVRGNQIPTSKKDKLSHGYGIHIMKRIALKYDGSCQFHSDDEMFTVKITLLNPIVRDSCGPAKE